jgi:hypothetical protein
MTFKEPPASAGKKSRDALVGSDKLYGMQVFDLHGQPAGTIERVLFDRSSGHAIYALVAFGGTLGMGEKHHPIPWCKLTYDPQREVYVADLDTLSLADAPAVGAKDEIDWDPAFGERIDLYYRVPSMWVHRI